MIWQVWECEKADVQSSWERGVQRCDRGSLQDKVRKPVFNFTFVTCIKTLRNEILTRQECKVETIEQCAPVPEEQCSPVSFFYFLSPLFFVRCFFSFFISLTILIFPLGFLGDNKGMRDPSELPQRGEVRGEAGQGVPHQDQDRPSAGGADQTGQCSPVFVLMLMSFLGERMQRCARNWVQTAQRLEASVSKHHRMQVSNPTQF